MPLIISKVATKSPAAKAGLKTGDVIVMINGGEVNDFLDLQYHCSDQLLDIHFQRAGQNNAVRIHNRLQSFDLGIEPEPHRIKGCANNCIFCFIDQMPPHQRKSLYFKDDDFLYSFVYGNYISLSNLNEKDYLRISEQRISPLYISVHTTNPVLRQKIMRYCTDQDILSRLRWLSKEGISFHTQIVSLPGINDGEELKKTLKDLSAPDLNTLSIGIVPVGLTESRQKLFPLRQYDRATADALLALVEQCRMEYHFPEIYCADEFYLLSGRDIPPDEAYDDYCQLENGIGMIRMTSNNWKKNKKKFLNELKGRSLLLITGYLAYSSMELIAAELNRMAKSDLCSLIRVKNRFFGASVTVSGLLTFQDVKQSLQELPQLPEIVALSSNMFNNDELTIDGYDRKQIETELARKVMIIDELWRDWG